MKYRIEFEGEQGKRCFAQCKFGHGDTCPGLGHLGCPAVKVEKCVWKYIPKGAYLPLDTYKTDCLAFPTMIDPVYKKYCPNCGREIEVKNDKTI